MDNPTGGIVLAAPAISLFGLVVRTTRGQTSKRINQTTYCSLAAGKKCQLWRAILNQFRLVRGSSASRRPSPIKLIASTVTKIATPGGSHSHQKFSSI